MLSHLQAFSSHAFQNMGYTTNVLFFSLRACLAQTFPVSIVTAPGNSDAILEQIFPVPFRTFFWLKLSSKMKFKSFLLNTLVTKRFDI